MQFKEVDRIAGELMKTLTNKVLLILVAVAVLVILVVQPTLSQEGAYRVVLELTGLT